MIEKKNPPHIHPLNQSKVHTKTDLTVKMKGGGIME